MLVELIRGRACTFQKIPSPTILVITDSTSLQSAVNSLTHRQALIGLAKPFFHTKYSTTPRICNKFNKTITKAAKK